MDKPKTLFKYERFCDHSLQNLKAHSIHFASPREFNDPYDCTITVRLKTPTITELEEIKEAIISQQSNPRDARFEFARLDRSEFRKKLMRIATEKLNFLTEDFLSNRGVTCFSERKDDLLMWSHYGDSHRGFCLEFHTKFDTFAKARQVRYSDVMPQIDLIGLFHHSKRNFVGDLYCTKSAAWSYEREWRLLHFEAGTLHRYEDGALKSIYFGPRMDAQAKDKLHAIVLGLNSEIECWQVSQAMDRFELEFEKIGLASSADLA